MHTQLVTFTHSGELDDERLAERATAAALLVIGAPQHPAWWSPEQAATVQRVSDHLAARSGAATLRHADTDATPGRAGSAVVYLDSRRRPTPRRRR